MASREVADPTAALAPRLAALLGHASAVRLASTRYDRPHLQAFGIRKASAAETCAVPFATPNVVDR